MAFDDPKNCSICLQETVISNPATFDLPCNHVCCSDCLESCAFKYEKGMISAADALSLPCPFPGCQEETQSPSSREILSTLLAKKSSLSVIQMKLKSQEPLDGPKLRGEPDWDQHQGEILRSVIDEDEARMIRKLPYDLQQTTLRCHYEQLEAKLKAQIMDLEEKT